MQVLEPVAAPFFSNVLRVKANSVPAGVRFKCEKNLIPLTIFKQNCFAHTSIPGRQGEVETGQDKLSGNSSGQPWIDEKPGK